MTITESATLTAGTWAIDPAHTEVGFTVRHLGISKVRGRFNTFTGSVQVGDDLRDSIIRAEIDLASVDTNNDQRDGHLRSADFFDAETHPKMIFESTRIEGDDVVGVIHGTLTINGVSRPVTLDTEHFGVGVDPYGTSRAGFFATTVISRKDFGIDFDVPLEAGNVLVGDKVSIELDVQIIPEAD